MGESDGGVRLRASCGEVRLAHAYLVRVRVRARVRARARVGVRDRDRSSGAHAYQVKLELKAAAPCGGCGAPWRSLALPTRWHPALERL